MDITYTQCKQLSVNYELRGIVGELTDQPEWLDYELSIADIQAIQQGGCESGAYMPAVTYGRASEVMAEYGDEVLEFIESHYELLRPTEGMSWSQIASFYLSVAVELWASNFDLTNVNWD